MHKDGLRETNCFSCQPLDPRPPRQMFAFDLLGVDFADGMGSCGQMTSIDSGSIGIKVHEPKRLEQLLPLSKDLIRATPQHLGQPDSGKMINRVPPPALVNLTAHETPHLLDLRRFHAPHFDRNRVGTTPFDHVFVHR